MSTVRLGRLKRVDIREIWNNEATDFTPWLASSENLALLGGAIGLELELKEVECSVGNYSADIVCQETSSERLVVIENQLERTDNPHLGQIMTYAAGLEASTVIWVSRHVTDEHRAVLDWLNSFGEGKVAFFGLEIEAWRIGESPPAPKFNVVSRPNDWQPPESSMSETQKAQLQFWMQYKELLEDETSIQSTKPSLGSWISHPVGRSGFHLSSVISTYDSVSGTAVHGELRVELVIDNVQSKRWFTALKADEAAIQAELAQLMPESLSWHSRDQVRMCRIYVRTPADLLDTDDWPRQHGWLKEHVVAFDTVFRSRLAQLGLSASEDDVE